MRTDSGAVLWTNPGANFVLTTWVVKPSEQESSTTDIDALLSMVGAMLNSMSFLYTADSVESFDDLVSFNLPTRWFVAQSGAVPDSYRAFMLRPFPTTSNGPRMMMYVIEPSMVETTGDDLSEVFMRDVFEWMMNADTHTESNPEHYDTFEIGGQAYGRFTTRVDDINIALIATRPAEEDRIVALGLYTFNADQLVELEQQALPMLKSLTLAEDQ